MGFKSQNDSVEVSRPRQHGLIAVGSDSEQSQMKGMGETQEALNTGED